MMCAYVLKSECNNIYDGAYENANLIICFACAGW